MSALHFEERRNGSIEAMLGAVTVATIVEVDHPPARGAFTMLLPPWAQVWEFAESADAAKDVVRKRVEAWLQAAGLKGSGS